MWFEGITHGAPKITSDLFRPGLCGQSSIATGSFAVPEHLVVDPHVSARPLPTPCRGAGNRVPQSSTPSTLVQIAAPTCWPTGPTLLEEARDATSPNPLWEAAVLLETLFEHFATHHVACRHSVWIQPYPPAAFSTRPKTLLELLPPVPLWPGPSFALTQVDWLDCDLSLPLASSHAPPELKQRLATLPRWHDHPRAAEVYQLLVYTDGSATPVQPGPTPCGVGLCGSGRCPGSVSLCWLQFTSGYASRLRIILWRMPGHTARGRTVGTCMGYGLDMGFGSCIRS